jgi:hypothetical protein
MLKFTEVCMSEPIYRASPGFRISHRDAAILGPAWEKLEKSLGRPVTPEDLAAEAQKPKSAFHPYFEWDPAKQARLYLIERARYLITSLDVILPEGGEDPVRAIIPVLDGSGGFISTRQAVASRPDVIVAQIERARSDAKLVVERYQGWIAFQGFSPAVDFVRAAQEFAAQT